MPYNWLRAAPTVGVRLKAWTFRWSILLGVAAITISPIGAQINPEDGRTILREIDSERSQLAAQQRAEVNLTHIPYFMSSFDDGLINDNWSSCDNLLTMANGALPSLNFQAAEQYMAACRPYMQANDVLLKEDSATSPARFQQSKPDEFSAPTEVLRPAPGLETRTNLSNQLALTQRLVNRVWFDVVEGRGDFAKNTPECMQERLDFSRELRYRDTTFRTAWYQLHLLQYGPVHDAVWKMYAATQHTAGVCEVR